MDNQVGHLPQQEPVELEPHHYEKTDAYYRGRRAAYDGKPLETEPFLYCACGYCQQQYEWGWHDVTDMLDEWAAVAVVYGPQAGLDECRCKVCQSQTPTKRLLGAEAEAVLSGKVGLGGLLEILDPDGKMVTEIEVTVSEAELERRSAERDVEQSIGRYED